MAHEQIPSQINLQALQQAKSQYPQSAAGVYPDQSAFDQYLIGSLAALVSPEDWQFALEIVQRAMAYTADIYASKSREVAHA